MEDRVDVTKFELVSEIAFKKSAYLSSNYSYYSVAGFKEEVSCFYLRKIIKGKEEEIIERINLVYFEAVKNSRSTGIVINNMQLSVADLIWARLCVLAYYYYKDDPLWTGFIFEKLEEKIEGNILKQELLIAKKAIDKLFDDKQTHVVVFLKSKLRQIT